ncbi:MAG: DNA-formamidopyrimidine glycosylase family protein [Daejeonella sp.]
MPEAPQIRIIAKLLQQFVGQKIIEAIALTDDLDLKRLEGKAIKEISVFGKQILIHLPKFTVRVHLMMFGRVKINERNKDGKLRLGLKFKDSELNFYACDIYLIDEPLDEVFDWSTDVMSPEWDFKKALEKLKAQKDKIIADVLIDQDIFNGLGNKGVNEALYRAKVHPASIVGAIPANKLSEIVKDAVEFSFDYFNWEQKGIAKDNFSVYRKKKCPIDGTPVQHEKVGTSGRKSHFCSEYQKLYV